MAEIQPSPVGKVVIPNAPRGSIVIQTPDTVIVDATDNYPLLDDQGNELRIW